MAPRRPAPKPDNVQRIMEFLERFGISTALLIAGAYFGFTLIIEPLAKTYREVISEVAASAKALEKIVEENGSRHLATQMKMDQTMKALEENHANSNLIKSNIIQTVKALELKIDAALSRMGKKDE